MCITTNKKNTWINCAKILVKQATTNGDSVSTCFMNIKQIGKASFVYKATSSFTNSKNYSTLEIQIGFGVDLCTSSGEVLASSSSANKPPQLIKKLEQFNDIHTIQKKRTDKSNEQAKLNFLRESCEGAFYQKRVL